MTFASLPPVIDYALVTHAHPDHFNIETLLRLRSRIRTLVVPKNFGLLWGDVSLKLIAHQLGFRDIVEVGDFESLPIPQGEIVTVPFLGEHGDLAHGTKSAFLIRLGDKTALFAADSICHDPAIYSMLRKWFGPVETVFMASEPSSGSPYDFSLGPLLPKVRNRKLVAGREMRSSTPDECLKVLEHVGARRYFNYALGFEPYCEYMLGPSGADNSAVMQALHAFLETLAAKGIVGRVLRGPTTLPL